MGDTKVITVWYRIDADDGSYHLNHLEDGYDPTRKHPTPKVPEQAKMWKNGPWAQQRALLLHTGPTTSPRIIEHEEIVPVG